MHDDYFSDLEEDDCFFEDEGDSDAEDESDFEEEEDEEDDELLPVAIKCQSFQNLLPLEILCMKAIIREFSLFSNSTVLENLSKLYRHLSHDKSKSINVCVFNVQLRL